ncbi:SET domain-containing protein [Pseudomonas poae]|nr:SET domain-containing protein [Pseudomonas poae]
MAGRRAVHRCGHGVILPSSRCWGRIRANTMSQTHRCFRSSASKRSRAVLTYLFGTRSGNRSISALNSGNTLSLVNTSQLPNGPVWKANNVMSIAVGKNLAFYVALKDIKKGDELLLDYGPLYETVPATAIKPDPDA